MRYPRIAFAIGLLVWAFGASAQTDERKVYIVQLADAPLASYAGTIPGLAATRPDRGAKLDPETPRAKAYMRHLDTQRGKMLGKMRNVKMLYKYNMVFNGFSAQLTEDEVRDLKKTQGVLSVTESEIHKPDTISTPRFLGISVADGLWSQRDGALREVRGEDVIVGVIDTGVWPENNSFSDKIGDSLVYVSPPAHWRGTCQTGPGFTAAMCNNKLIGARYYIDGFNADNGTLTTFEYVSPRDGGGHGSHTASTAAGNADIAASINGVPAGNISGIAPRARVAVYKVCWTATFRFFSGCYTADTVKAIDDAVADGVDVINYSISGTKTDFLDPVEIAFFNAAAAGVFVAASAGNDGPGNEVAHISPWLTTVAASTHDRFAVATVSLIAPVMAGFSSRGPNRANRNILKPDITGPGVDVIAAFVDTSLTQAQHDALVLNNFTPGANAGTLSGTSMSSPHIAGAAALLKQLNPSWSPAAIKSALMTTTTDVKLGSGATDPNPFGYGAGHMNPNGAANPGLVYDAGSVDYARFLCGLNLTPPTGAGSCATLGTIHPWNLNLASLTASEVAGRLTLTRRVTNVSGASAVFNATADLPGWDVAVSPSSLSLDAGASADFNLTLTRTSAAIGAQSFGSLTWSDGVRQVRSPLSARGVLFAGPAEVFDLRASGRGSKIFTVTTGYGGTMSVVPTGLVPATLSVGNVTTRACFDFTVVTGAQLARFQLFNTDTLGGAATDLDLDVFSGPNGSGSLRGRTGQLGSNEVLTFNLPAAGIYSACVVGFSTPASGASFTLSSWIVGPAAGTQTLRASGPTSAVLVGGTASIGLGWSVVAGKRYLGHVQYRDGANALLGSTIVNVDNR